MGILFLKKKESLVVLDEEFPIEKLPILTLDKRWHSLFDEKKSNKIIKLENTINDLLKEQGSLNNENKQIQQYKKRLLDSIINLTSQVFDENNKEAKEKMENDKLKIIEINSKTENIEKRLEEIPLEIKQVNRNLFLVGANQVYSQIIQEKHKIENIEKWIVETRQSLKEKIFEKEELEKKSEKVYTYMHDLVGPEVIEIIDRKIDRKIDKNI